ncbi:nuclear transport factor 2 family protein [Micromonospora sp. NBC_01813]|uniref:nuclear transport factor 2 family protein n=1 Tax=Micromonospora sp. NBC_01813 TaxID=2975988 RepID=UPI002DDA3851|nr:nuclear transport factor 2 family protein [Micromonospora sp. NBC_01813]WSA10085.1 nuclear transport factor 2 family protein [Micromonospora sp. NBC_01813]
MPEYADDRAAIVELMSRYAQCCDRREFDAVGDCFTDDAQAEYSGKRLPRGVRHIVAHMAPLARLAASQHVVGSVTVEVVGDHATASSYTVAHLVRPVDDGHEVVHRGLHYADRLVRTGDGWRISERVHQVLWSTSTPTTWPVPRFTTTPQPQPAS